MFIFSFYKVKRARNWLMLECAATDLTKLIQENQ
jgi:hypothetical protein